MNRLTKSLYFAVKRITAKRAMADYVRRHAVRRLILGAGPCLRQGWLSTDLKPGSGRSVLDVTRPFPFAGETFESVYSEHLIEHLSWPEGIRMLEECRRILRPRGRIRIATPDLEVILGLYGRDRDPEASRYIRWITDRNLKDISVYKASFVINNAFRNYGHRFLYDGELLEMALTQSGFTDIQRREVGLSDDENFRGIESHGKIIGSPEMAAFETMVFEATRPA